jgi:hypothetical protein
MSGRLYIDHLTYALVTYALALQVLTLETRAESEQAPSNALPHPRLKRVVDLMETELPRTLTSVDWRSKVVTVEIKVSAPHT